MISEADKKHALWKDGFEQGQQHTKPSRETVERLTKVETLMEQNTKEHQEIKSSIERIENKIDNALSNKADKSEVFDIKKDVDILKNWRWYLLGAIAVMGFLIYLAKDILLKYI